MVRIEVRVLVFFHSWIRKVRREKEREGKEREGKS